MVDFWALSKVSYKCHVQWPGQAFPVHIDKLWHRSPEDPGLVVRIQVFLTKFVPGQIMLYGNCPLIQWDLGDVYMFDHYNLPHATCNISTEPRALLVLTGERTEETDQKLKTANLFQQHEI